jgi:uncharacterized protein
MSMAKVLMAAVIPALWMTQAAGSDAIGDGKRFVESLVKEDSAGAIAMLAPALKKELPEPKLRDLWQAVLAKVGPFEKVLGATAAKLPGYDVVLVTCRFKRATLDAKVVFDAQGQVAGLGFLPSAAEPPPYARPGAFHEKAFTVGRGAWRLPGTLTLPAAGAGPWPAVVLVHGSGPQDRDETIGANKPFRDLAWGLAAKGVVVLRYEKRTKEYPGKWAKGPGQFTVQAETVDDALSAVAQLRATEGIDAKRIVVLGHSLGGIVAPRIGRSDPQIGGLIILAGCLSRPLEDVWVERARYRLSRKAKPSDDEKKWLAALESHAASVKRLTAADLSSSVQLEGAPPAYWLDLRQYDPLAVAKKLKQPLLVLQGGRDYQTGQVDFDRWKEAFGNRSKVTFKRYPQLNHLFIAGEGESTPEEYLQAGHVAETVVTDIAEWIRDLR